MAFLINGALIWTVLLLFNAVMKLNDYSTGKTLFVCFLTVCAVVLIWFIALFGYALAVRLARFVQDIIREFQLL